MIIRLIAFAVVSGLYFLVPWWLVIVAACAYAAFWPGYELMVLGVIVDSVFGHIHLPALPLYTLMSILIVIMAAVIKPFISFYDA